MPAFHRFLASSIVVAFALTSSFIVLNAAPRQTQTQADIPAFHAEAPAGAPPATMAPAEFTDPLVKNAYAAAGKVRAALYQQPCYCHCDRSQGHTSLLDCFTSKHGSGCGTCIAEALYTYEQTRKGRTPQQIRQGIERGDWKTFNLNKYKEPVLTK